jgi:hypothetical protein
MKPLNLDNRPCSPISSNCVVWQGPTLDCINLCTGDTISDVVANLATELCTLLDQTNVSGYNLTCLGITACGPKDFQALIQLLIDKICELEGIPTGNTKDSGACPDCVVTVASCFRTGNATTMQLLDYVQMIAEKVCALIDQIGVLQTQIDSLDVRVTALENAVSPSFTLPSFIVDCTLDPVSVLGGNSYPIDTILNALVNNDIYGYCALLGSTGLPEELSAAVASACITASTPTVSNAPTPYGTEYLGSWVNTPTTVADTINNLWIVICDIYDFVSGLSLNVADTNSVNLTLTSGVLTAAVQDTGWVRLLGFDYIPNNNAASPPMVRRIGNVLHFKGTIIVPLANGSSALTWDYAANQDSYFDVFNCVPFQGAGGVYTNPNGSVVFNYTGVGTTCDSVIPPSIIPAGYQLDDRYQNPAGWKVAQRIVPIDWDPILRTSDNSTSLSTVFSQVIAANGTLVLGLWKDGEASWVSGAGGNNSFDTGHMNYIISHVTQGQKVPRFANAATTVYDNPTAVDATLPVDIRYESQYYYPFTCNANFEDNVGGFFQRLDGLTAFISPCGATIPTPDPCPK